jgi:hypothetical protein
LSLFLKKSFQGEGMLSQQNNPSTNKDPELQIKMLQNEPIDEDKLEVLLRAKEREKQEAMHIEDTHTGRLVTEEIEMLKVVLHFVMRKRQDYSSSSSIR